MITLTNIMKANAVSCIVFGVIFLFIPEQIQYFLSGNQKISNVVFSVIGIVLLFNGLHLIWASFKSIPNKLLVFYFSFGDFIWVLSTVYLMFAEVLITTPKGIVSTVLVSTMVGSFGLLQMFNLKK